MALLAGHARCWVDFTHRGSTASSKENRTPWLTLNVYYQQRPPSGICRPPQPLRPAHNSPLQLRSSKHSSRAVSATDPNRLSLSEMADKQNRLMVSLMDSVGAWSRLVLDEGENGRGLFVTQTEVGRHDPPVTASHAEGYSVYLRVPMKCVLFTQIQKCPADLSKDPVVAALLQSDHPWQIKMGGLLALLCCGSGMQLADSDICHFWWRYKDLLPCASEQTSTVFFSPEELEALQDPIMARHGMKWQSPIKEAHRKYFQRVEVPSYDDLRWGVGLAHSRSFTDPDSDQDAMIIPFLDMINHKPASQYGHSLTGNGSAIELRSLGERAAGSEATISYGNKSNARLLEQYGFIIPGNRNERVPLPTANEIGGLALDRYQLVVALGIDEEYGPRSPDMQQLHDAATRAAMDLSGRAPSAPGVSWMSLWGAKEEQRMLTVASELLENYALTSAPRDGPEATGAASVSIARLSKWIDARLGHFSTTIDADEAMLETQLSPRMELAVRYRLDRKHLLRAASRVAHVLSAAFQP